MRKVKGETEDPQLAKMRGLAVKVRARRWEAEKNEHGEPVVVDTMAQNPEAGATVMVTMADAQGMAEKLNAAHVGACLALGWRLL